MNWSEVIITNIQKRILAYQSKLIEIGANYPDLNISLKAKIEELFEILTLLGARPIGGFPNEKQY